MTKERKEVAKAERLIREAVSKINWKKHGFKVYSTGARNGEVQISGELNDPIAFDLTVQTYSPRR